MQDATWEDMWRQIPLAEYGNAHVQGTSVAEGCGQADVFNRYMRGEVQGFKQKNDAGSTSEGSARVTQERR